MKIGFIVYFLKEKFLKTPLPRGDNNSRYNPRRSASNNDIVPSFHNTHGPMNKTNRFLWTTWIIEKNAILIDTNTNDIPLRDLKGKQKRSIWADKRRVAFKIYKYILHLLYIYI